MQAPHPGVLRHNGITQVLYALLGVGVRPGAYIGVPMLLLMYTAGLILPEHNPIIDEHIVYAIIMLTLTAADAGRYVGLGEVWTKTSLVKRFPILE